MKKELEKAAGRFSNTRRERAAIERELLEEGLAALEALDTGRDANAYMRGRLYALVAHHLHESVERN